MAIGVTKAEFMDSNPYEAKAWDEAYKLQRQIQDERDWRLGQYVMSAFETVMANSFSKHSNAKYIEEPFLKHVSDEERLKKDPEMNERQALMEFLQFADVMRKQGLPETKFEENK